MKKATLVAVLVLFASTAAFAETAIGVPQMLMGKIKTVTLGNNQPGTLSEVVIVDAAGKESHMALTPKTTVSDKTGAKLTADKLAAGESVRIKSVDGKGASAILIEG